MLFLSVSGDRKRLERREDAQSLIASAECAMPQLGLLLEGSAVREHHRKTEDALSLAARAVFAPTACRKRRRSKGQWVLLDSLFLAAACCGSSLSTSTLV